MLLTIEQAAQKLNVPIASVKTAAEAHGLLIRMGRAVRIADADLEGLIQLCRNQPKAHASTGARMAANGSSAKQDKATSTRALEACRKLKQSSPSTSKRAIEAV